MEIKSGPTGADKNRKIMVDVIKGFCILMIIITHVANKTPAFRHMIQYGFTVVPAVSAFMIMSAYVFTISEDHYAGRKQRPWAVWDWFRNDRFYPRLRRFLIPYLIMVICLCAGIVFLLKGRLTLSNVWEILTLGGRGPGAYYVILMFEFLAAFPFIKYWADRDPVTALFGMLAVNIAFESMARYVWTLSDVIYDRLLLRFTVQIALGILLATYQKKIAATALPLIAFIIGLVYLVSINYMDYEQVLKIGRFTSGSFFTGLFCFGLIVLFLELEETAQRFRILLTPLSFLGKASYHILLVQMLYFYFARSFQLEPSFGSLGKIILIDYAVTLIPGCLFYLISEGIGKIFRKPRPSVETKK